MGILPSLWLMLAPLQDDVPTTPPGRIFAAPAEDSDTGADPFVGGDAVASGGPRLSRLQARQLAAWYAGLGGLSGSFGDTVVQAARRLRGKLYNEALGQQRQSRAKAPQLLEFQGNNAQSLSLVEAVLSVARCSLLLQRNDVCYVQQMQAFRYRFGEVSLAAERLDNFEDWVDDNVKRQRLKDVTRSLAGSAGAIGRHELSEVEAQLQPGDVVALLAAHRGVWQTHVGIYSRDNQGHGHFIHASGIIVETTEDLVGFCRRHHRWQEVLVVRPLPP